MFNLLDKHECLLFADRVKKFQSSGWKSKQERIIVVTTESVYNIKKDKVKRRIPLKLIEALTKTNIGLKNEFTIHVPTEYDYRYQTDRRDQIMDSIKRAYAEKFRKNLPVYGVDRPNLGEFTTDEKDKARGVNRMPPLGMRLKCEDLL